MAIIRSEKLKPKKLKSLDIELAVSAFFNPRKNLIVPNVHWGFGIHECDLMIVTPANYVYEVEIKVSKADLINDKKKKHQHIDGRIKFLYFGIPDYLEPFIEEIPIRAGIISVKPEGRCNILRTPATNTNYKLSSDEKYQIARLGALRIWGLKKKLQVK